MTLSIGTAGAGWRVSGGNVYYIYGEYMAALAKPPSSKSTANDRAQGRQIDLERTQAASLRDYIQYQTLYSLHPCSDPTLANSGMASLGNEVARLYKFATDTGQEQGHSIVAYLSLS